MRIVSACLATLVLASPASALTNDNGVIVFTHADALAGGVTPGDAPGYPVYISLPGSYRLGSPLTVTTAVRGIEIGAAEVTLDLGGFRMIGSNIGTDGIQSSGRATTVRNGTVRAFTASGILMEGNYSQVEGVRVNNNYVGISLNGGVTFRTFVSDSQAVDNQYAGINCLSTCKIENVQVSGSEGGIRLQTKGTIIASQLSGNQIGLIATSGQPAAVGDTHYFNNSIGSFSGSAFPLSPNRCETATC